MTLCRSILLTFVSILMASCHATGYFTRRGDASGRKTRYMGRRPLANPVCRGNSLQEVIVGAICKLGRKYYSLGNRPRPFRIG